ncbi:MAG: hypothetical protein C4321_10430, partial [Chloroflexota bacterium]
TDSGANANSRVPWGFHNGKVGYIAVDPPLAVGNYQAYWWFGGWTSAQGQPPDPFSGAYGRNDPRHNGGLNVTMVDGHTKFMKIEALTKTDPKYPEGKDYYWDLD